MCLVGRDLKATTLGIYFLIWNPILSADGPNIFARVQMACFL